MLTPPLARVIFLAPTWNLRCPRRLRIPNLLGISAYSLPRCHRKTEKPKIHRPHPLPRKSLSIQFSCPRSVLTPILPILLRTCLPTPPPHKLCRGAKSG